MRAETSAIFARTRHGLGRSRRHVLCSRPGVPLRAGSGRPGENIRDRAFRFGCRIIAFSKTLHAEGGIARTMASQLLRSGTALYPMLEEAGAAEGTRDFISKCNVGLKEIREAHGRLRFHEACSIGPAAEARTLRAEADELISIVTVIIRNTRARAGIARESAPRRMRERHPNWNEE